MALTFKDVAEILRIIDASNLEEVELEAQGIRVSVRRGSGAMPRKEGSATTENAAMILPGKYSPRFLPTKVLGTSSYCRN